MNPQLAALFAAHKGAFLAAGAAGVAGLALLRKKNAAAAGTGTTTTAGTTIAGTIPAAGVISSAGVQGVYPDTSSTDAYNQLEGQLERLQAGRGSQAVPVPAPVASTLYAPNYNGNYVRAAQGGLGEIESDGSILSLTLPQWQQAYAVAGSAGVHPQQLQAATLPTNYTTEANILTRATPTGGTAG